MKAFLKDHSYDMVKMFLNQFATAIFGFSLMMASMQAESYALRNISSAFSILFYLFLLYVTAWEIGYKDKIPTEYGRKKKNVMRGALIALCANSINFLFAIAITLGALVPNELFGNISAVGQFLAMLLEGMYAGLLAHPVGGVTLSSMWFMWFLVPLPAIIVSGVAYAFGLFDVKYTSVFNKRKLPASDREPKGKKG